MLRTITLCIATLALFATTALMQGCDDKAGAEVFQVTMAGERFYLEVAADPKARELGLMHRTEIAPDGGMIFVFPPRQVVVQSFWMKNCLTDMDILYLDGSGKVLTTYTMRAQPLQGQAGNPDETEPEYAQRIRETANYSSRFPSPIVIEVKAGTVERLGIKQGDQIHFDLAALKAKAR